MTGGKCHGRTMMDREGGEAYLMNAALHWTPAIYI
jgi:hypothetical protein